MSNKKIAAVYCRASTHLQEHSIQNQVSDLQSYAERRGWEVFKVYTDQGVSGAKDRRPGLDALMADARRGKFSVAIVTKFDRFARNAKHLLNALDEFKALEIDFCSVHDAIDSTTPYGKAMFTIIGAMAELERELIRERVIHGVRKARERGATLGRPKVSFDLDKARELQVQGLTFTAIGKSLGCSRETIRRALKAQNPSGISGSNGAVSTTPNPVGNKT